MPEENTITGRVTRVATRGYTLLTLFDEPRARPIGMVVRIDPHVYPHALLTAIGDLVTVRYDPGLTDTWRQGMATGLEREAPQSQDTIPALAINDFRNHTLETELRQRGEGAPTDDSVPPVGAAE